MAKKTLGYVHLEWTCPNCTTKNPGPQQFCNGCGAPQPEGVEFTQAAEEKLLTDKAEIERAKAGPDIHCPYCHARSPSGSPFCGACGGDLADAHVRKSGRVVGAHRSQKAPDIPCPNCATANPATALSCVQCGAALGKQAAPRAAKDKPTRRSGIAIFVIIGVVLCITAVVAFLIFSGRTEDLVGTVQGGSWQRSLAIEVLGPAEHETWLDEIPSDAQMGVCRTEYRYTSPNPEPNSEEICGTSYIVDEGTGSGEVVQDCEYRVYDDFCSYTQMEWVVFDTVTASDTDFSPYWPNVNLLTDQRQGAGTESYEVLFSTDNGTLEYSTSNADEYSSFQPGSEWILKVNTFDSIVDLEPAR
jgi:hypothetical protein